MAAPFELKFTTNLADLVGDLTKFASGLNEAAQVVGEVGAQGAAASEGINTVSAAAQENTEVVAEMAAATSAAAESENAEGAELARLTELLGSEANARASLAARIIDNTVTERASAEATANTVRVAQEATVTNRTYAESMSQRAAAFMSEEAAEATAANTARARNAERIAGLQRFSQAQLAARRTTESFNAGLASFTSGTREFGSLLTMLGLVNPQLLRAGVGVQMIGQAAETLGPKIAEAGAGVAGFAAVLGPILVIGAALVAVVAAVAEGVHLLSESMHEGAEQLQADDTLARYLGSLEAAKQRVQDINQQGITAIPIKLDDLDKADEKLTLFSRGALGSAESLKMVADAALGTQKPVEQVAEVVGRLEAALSSGQAPGRYATQLQRMGIITPGVVTELNNLHKEGAKGPEIWSVAQKAIMEWSGQSATSVRTVSGVMTLLSNTWSATLREFGAPILDSLRPLLSDLQKLMTNLVPLAREAGQEIAKAIGTVYGLVKNGEFTDALATEIEIGVDRGVAHFLSAFHSAVETIKGWVHSIWDDLSDASIKAKASSIWSALSDENIKATANTVWNGTSDQSIKNAVGVTDEKTGPAEADLQKEADGLEKHLSDVLKRASDTVSADAPQYSGKTMAPGEEVDPDSKSKGSGGGAKGRKAEVDQGAEAEKAYRMQLDLTSESLALGNISQGQAMAQNAQTITAYIEHLKDLQKNLAPTSDKYKELAVRILDAQQAMAKTSVFGQVRAGLIQLRNQFGDLGKEMSSMINGQITGTIDTLSNTMGELAMGVNNTRQAFSQWMQSTISGLVKLGGQMLAHYILSKTLKSQDTADTLANNTAKTASNTVAGLTESLTTWGISAAVGAAAFLAAMAISGGFESGGYTGGREGQPAGLVHGEEFVFRPRRYAIGAWAPCKL